MGLNNWFSELHNSIYGALSLYDEVSSPLVLQVTVLLQGHTVIRTVP